MLSSGVTAALVGPELAGVPGSELGGVAEVREQIAEFAGIVVGAELRHLRAVGPAIAAVDWTAHDEDQHDEDQHDEE